MSENNVYLNNEEKTMTEMNQYLTFKLGNENYGLVLEKAKEIIKPPKITNVPNTEKHVMGVINIRGKVTPVIDLKEKLGLPKNDIDEDSNKIIITNIEGIMVGLFIDNVREVVSIDNKEIENTAEGDRSIEAEYIRGVFTNENNLIIIINIEEILFGKNNSLEEAKNA